MKISFVIPAYNEEDSIGQCLQSIEEELARARDLSAGQGVDAEVVVVNNASSDKTKEIAQSFAGVRVVDEMQKGLVRARKAGFEATTGELVANLDADTLVPPGWLAKVVAEFDTDNNLVALSGPYVYHDLSLFHRALVKLFYFFGYLLHKLGLIALLQGGNFVLRRTAWQKVGGFDTSIAFYGEDTDVAKRLYPIGKVKWTWGLPMYTSGRRLQQEGLVRMSMRYTINNFWMFWFGKPFTKKYKDIRS